jgi:DNA-binding MarR family transcriptional regulator
LLRALERSQYCCAIADAARLLGVSRQRAHLIARSAERLGLLELLPNPDDRRIVQLFLTRSARDELAAARSEEGTWIATLLLGLDEHRLSATTRAARDPAAVTPGRTGADTPVTRRQLTASMSPHPRERGVAR